MLLWIKQYVMHQSGERCKKAHGFPRSSQRGQKLLEVQVSKESLNQSPKCIKAEPIGKSN